MDGFVNSDIQPIKILKYDVDVYNFTKEVASVYGISDLSEIHNKWVGAKSYEIFYDIREDQSTVYHQKFYRDIVDTNFYDLYYLLIKNVVSDLIQEDFLYQKIPTFRVHLPNNLAVGEYHRDREYSHSSHEINFYLPLTKAWGTNTIWTETEYNKNNFYPLNVDVGEIVMWDGANLLHGNKMNDTGKARVSVDFRILPLSKYKNTDNRSLSSMSPTKMVIGEYWERFEL